MTLGEWIDKFGEPATADLVKRLSGQRVYIPSEGRLHPELYAALGDRAEDLRSSHTGQRVEIPTLDSVRREVEKRARHEEVRMLISKGLTNRAIERVTGMGRTSVRRIRLRAAQ